MRRKRKRNKVQSIGGLIDLPFDTFKEEVIKQKVPIGVLNNYILLFESSYSELRGRKDAILDLVYSGEKTKDEVQTILEGLYAEMTKLEQKIVFMKDRVSVLMILGD